MNFKVSSRFAQEDFCRLCLCSIYELRPLFPGTTPEASSMLCAKIKLLAEINIDPAEELNSRICCRCLQQLEDFDSFRRRCKDSDNQIRKIRTFHQSRHVSFVDDEGQPDEASRTSGISRFGGVFDSLEYCADMAVPGEYRLLYDGCVYRRESLLVWRCEDATCPCQLLVQDNYDMVRIYKTHNHWKVFIDREDRKFEKMSQRICEFLTKLRDQNYITSEQESSNNPQTSNEEQPVQPTPKLASIRYYVGGDQPSILFDGQQYYHEAATDNVMQSQIHWKCSEKNCLGLATTSVDCKNFRLLENHNHQPKSDHNTNVPLVNRSPKPMSTAPKPITNRQELNPSHTIAGPCGIHRSSNPSGTNLSTTNQPPLILQKALTNLQPPLRCDSSNEGAAPVVTLTECLNRPNQQEKVFEKQKKKSTQPKNKKFKLCSGKSNESMVFYRNHSRTYYMRYRTRFYYKDVSENAKMSGSATFWRCIAKRCPVTMTVRANMKPIPDSNHNHGYIKGVTRRLTEVKPSEALQKLPAVPNIAFYRSPVTQGICLLYRQFSYNLHLGHSASGFLVWECKTDKCPAWVHSGTDFEYLVPKDVHNHDVPADETVDVDHHVSVPDALRMLRELKNRSLKS